jgi:drug/metabolite transporter (DMT)-like permease
VLVTTQTMMALVFGLMLAPFAWVTPSASDIALLSLLGVTGMAAHVCINRSLKLAPASTVVPFQYTTIVWAILLGYWVFGDVPDAAMLAGAGIIIAAGLFIFVREQRLARTRGYEPPPG